eukprot:TRINITY_DN4356_c0_g1_i1.p1 TRINITY_DN4356_c0_g1~~TRINITY_DN4356_c0_g1_i1.p1  ORF type:complete len:320 (-),score=81.85 TRINITY_DN4356_c0_g1_i1:6-929(-)
MAKLFAFCGCVAVLLVSVAYAQQNPGLKFSMLSSTLNSAVGQVIADINQKILQTPIPDQSGSAGIPILGKVKWTVSNIKIASLDFTDSALTTVDGVGFQLVTSNANAHITLDWEVSLKSIIVSFDEKGTASIKTTNADATWQVAVTEANAHLSAALAVNSFVLNNLRIHVTADDIPRWLLEIVTALLDRPVKRYLEQQVQSEVQSLVVDLNTSLQAMNTLLALGDVLALDVSYPQNPVFTSSYYSIPWLGMCPLLYLYFWIIFSFCSTIFYFFSLLFCLFSSRWCAPPKNENSAPLYTTLLFVFLMF